MFNRPCPVCASKEAHLQSLLAEIEMLRKLVLPPTPAPNWELVRDEANQVLDGAGMDRPVSEAERDRYEQVKAEADRLLTGNY